MKKSLIVLLSLLVCSGVFAQSNYFFEADFDTDDFRGWEGPFTAQELSDLKLYHEFKSIDTELLVKRYRILITKAERDDGWAAFGGKVAGKARAVTDHADFNKSMNSVMKAFAKVFLDEINILRAEHSLAPRTPAQFKAALKSKLP